MSRKLGVIILIYRSDKYQRKLARTNHPTHLPWMTSSATNINPLSFAHWNSSKLLNRPSLPTV